MQSNNRWGSKTAFVFATAAAAVGLGNIWRFPYLVGENGGSAFVLVYLLAVIALGFPLVLAEMVIGKMGRANPAKSVAELAEKSKRSRAWAIIGGSGIIASFLILGYYLVISGWVLDYFLRAVLGQFYHATEASAQAAFASLKATPWQMLMGSTAVAIVMVSVLLSGLKAGLERAVLILFPAFLVILVLLLIYSIQNGDFAKGVDFLFRPDFSAINGSMILQALGQAFFSLNIGMGVTIMFSAYLPKNVPLLSSAVYVTLADTLIALLAGLIIFPIVFKHNLHPDAGPSLIFQTLPLAFGQIKGGYFIGCLFFLLLFLAAFTSIIALLEPAIVWVMERFYWSRKKAVLITGAAAWVLSLGTVYSFHPGHWAVGGHSFFDMLDWASSRVLIPLTGLGIAFFIGWVLRKKLLQEQLGWQVQRFFPSAWIWLLKWVAPLGIVIILIKSLGVI